MSDGKIVFSTQIDNSQVEKDLKDTKRKIQQATDAISKAENAKMPLTKQAEDLGTALDTAKAKLHALKKEQSSIASAMVPGADPGAYIEAAANKPAVEAEIKSQQKEVDRLQKKWDGINNKIDSYDAKIKDATAALHANQEKAGQLSAKLSKGGVPLGKAFDKASRSVHDFTRRIISIGKSAFVFSLVYAGLRSVVSYMGKVLNTNEQYRAQLAQLKGALLTAFQPIYEFVLPGVLAVLRILTAIVSVVANVFSALGGKSMKRSADNAKALNKEAAAIGGVGAAAKEAQRQLAGFDEINKLDSQESGSGGGGGGGGGIGGIEPDFDAFNTDEYKAKIDELTVYLSGALLALGAILAFSGANIPLGIALMAAGAVGLAAVIKENWGAMSSQLKTAITRVLVILGGAALAVGAVLAFSGISIVKGIALMAVGAAALGGAAYLNWNTIQTALQGPIGTVTAMVSGALLVLGIILCCTGVALPLGIALIAAGAVGLVTVAAVNWNMITEKVKGVWDSIKEFWNTHCAQVFTIAWWTDKFQSIGDGLKSAIRTGINAAIGLVNNFTSWLSRALSFSIPPMSVGGHEIFGGFSASVSIPQIPYLARGAVLPANNPFLAVVGDQRSGTNIEAPLDTIKQAVAEVTSPTQILDLMADIISLLAQIRDGNGEIDMRKLSRLITKYQRELARAGG